MTSQINPNDINGAYPVAGVPNDTQGFRTNFTNTKTNFQYAEDEINDLQSKAVLKAALTGATLDNNMADNLIYAAKIQDFSGTIAQLTTTSGSVTVDYSIGHYQTISTTGSISLAFTNDSFTHRYHKRCIHSYVSGRSKPGHYWNTRVCSKRDHIWCHRYIRVWIYNQ